MRNRMSRVLAGPAVLGASVLAAAGANAALPTDAATAITAMGTNATDTLAAYWPVYIIVVGGFVLIKFFKRGASKL